MQNKIANFLMNVIWSMKRKRISQAIMNFDKH